MPTDNFKKTVLIVEDDVMLQKALTEKLTHEGFNILIANDGAEGLELALEKHPDVITLDISLPKKDGIEFLDEIRQDPWGKTARIIVLTNSVADDKIVSKIAADQPSYYLIKSNTSLGEIVTKVTELVQDLN